MTTLPKAELHVHLEGTLEPEDMVRFAARNGLELPWRSPDELRAAYGSAQTSVDTGGGAAQGLVDTSLCGFGLARKDVTVPKPYPREFRDDVVAAARRGETPLKQVARISGSPSLAWPTDCAPPTSRTAPGPA